MALDDILLGKAVTLVLAALAFAVGLATFVFLARGAPFVLRPGVGVGLVLANLSAVLLLVAVLAGRLTRVWVERRRGSAGARLHVRLVLLFGQLQFQKGAKITHRTTGRLFLLLDLPRILEQPVQRLVSTRLPATFRLAQDGVPRFRFEQVEGIHGTAGPVECIREQCFEQLA